MLTYSIKTRHWEQWRLLFFALVIQNMKGIALTICTHFLERTPWDDLVLTETLDAVLLPQDSICGWGWGVCPLSVKQAGEAIGSSVRLDETSISESKNRDKLRSTRRSGNGGYDV